jgi:hypothetical protein
MSCWRARRHSPEPTGANAARRLAALGLALVTLTLGASASAAPRADTQSSHRASSSTAGPLLRLGPKLGEGAEGGESGAPTSVALSSNGDTALVGAPDAAGGVGSVAVFTRSGSNWIQQGPALAGNGEVGQGGFGWSVALSADGAVALIGGLTDGAPHEGQCCATGAVWVFTRTGSTWTQQGPKLTDGHAGGAGEFGSSVALSSRGAAALIGARAFGRAGAAWMFTHTRSGWRRGVELTSRSASPHADFGTSVVLSSDGRTALVGGDQNTGGGAAWIFTRRQHSTRIHQDAKLLGQGIGPFVSFGGAVALSSAGTTALVGAGGEDREQGAAWIFERSGSSWLRRKKLTAGGERGLGNFGQSVALSSNGKIALIGSFMEEGIGLSRTGAAWLFSGSGSSWTRRQDRIDAPSASGEDGLFGESLALSGSGATALVGVEVDNGGPGAAWVLAD